MKVFVAACLLLLPLAATADAYDKRLIHTNGYGEVKVKPDRAKVSLSVSAIHKEALDAKTDVDKRVDNFLAAAQKAGIKKKDITASRLHTRPQYEYSRMTSKQQFVGYNATRTLTVTVRKLEQLTDIMDLALQHKIQNIGNISYESSDEDKHRNQARLDAIENSKQKAAALAKAYGAELGAIVNIQYFSHHNPGAHVMQAESADMGMMRAAAATAKATYLPDEITFSDNIQVVFDLIINR